MQICVQTAHGKYALWADQAPDYGCVEEDAAVGAIELVGLVAPPRAHSRTATCTMQAHSVAIVWAMNIDRGGIFMYWPSLRS